jgi:cytochrome c biogenesis protein CcdA
MPTIVDEHPLVSMLNETRNYVETRIDLVQYKTIDKTSRVAGSLLSSIILVAAGFLVMLIIGFGLALLIGERLGKPYYGFFVIGGIFLIFALLLYGFRREWMKTPITNHIIRNIFNHKS